MPPTYIAERETAFDTVTSPKATASFDVLVGDVLVAYAVKEDASGAISAPTNSGTAFTFR